MEQLKTKLAGAQCAPFVSELSGVGKDTRFFSCAICRKELEPTNYILQITLILK